MALLLIKPGDLPVATSVDTDGAVMVHNGLSVEQATPAQVVNAGRPIASEAEAITGTDNTKAMTPLSTSQAIAASPFIGSTAPFATRAAFIAANIPSPATRAEFFVNGNTYAVVRDASGPIVQTNGQTWRPDGDVTPQHFGAVGDGVADDTAAIQAAMHAAVAFGSVVDFGPSVYLSGGLTKPSGVSLRGVPGSTTIKLVGNPAVLLECTGSIDGGVMLTAAANKGDTTIAVGDTSGFAIGDYVLITDNVSYAATDASYKSGEIVQVAGVSAGVLTLHSELSGSIATRLPGAYTVDNAAKVQKVNTVVGGKIEGITFVGNPLNLTRLINFEYAVSPEVSRCTLRDGGSIGMMFRGCVDAYAHGNTVYDLTDDTANGHSGYGVALVGPSKGGIITNNTFSRCRHGFTTMGGVTGFPHGFVVSDNNVYDTSQSGIDTHASGDDCVIQDNRVTQSKGAGISIRSLNTVVKGNVIRDCDVHGILLAEDRLYGVTLDGNFIYNALGHGISCSPSCPELKIIGNYIENSGADGITVFSGGTIDSTGLSICGNHVAGFGAVLASRSGIVLAGSVNSTGVLVLNNIVEAGAAISPTNGVKVTGAIDGAVCGNKAKGPFGASHFQTGANVSLDNRPVDGNALQLFFDPTAPALKVTGPADNADMQFIPKGTGRVRFGTHTASADTLVTGYVEIKDSSGVVRRLAVIN